MTGTFAAGQGASTLVQLVDRRTGSVHRVDGRPVAAWVPSAGIAESTARMMAGRDPQVWMVRVMEMETSAPQKSEQAHRSSARSGRTF